MRGKGRALPGVRKMRPGPVHLMPGTLHPFGFPRLFKIIRILFSPSRPIAAHLNSKNIIGTMGAAAQQMWE